ncbi:hypothetical protein PoB_002659800 [Plakobranchus ocellatus]|uniref:Uncharacterized protein n=1 Tax=Plakobranchus ocellatus TaxID=259542 RepID=A0AAV4A059_9GAST|nr:hypothetical protein PoB_002659800 [Plakobranchus ocellatus]
MATSVKKSPIVVMAPLELHLRKFYGDGGASDTRRFLEEIQAAWESQRCETDREKRCLLWSHLGVEVRQELNCLLDGDTSDPHKMLALLSSSYGEQEMEYKGSIGIGSNKPNPNIPGSHSIHGALRTGDHSKRKALQQFLTTTMDTVHPFQLWMLACDKLGRIQDLP